MITDTLKSAIGSLSKRYGIKEKELRIKISKPEDSLKYEIMKNADVLDETNIATALNINSIMAFMVSNKLNTIIDSLVKEFAIRENSVNVRIYTKTDDCEPLLYLFDGVTPKCKLNINKFI